MLAAASGTVLVGLGHGSSAQDTASDGKDEATPQAAHSAKKHPHKILAARHDAPAQTTPATSPAAPTDIAAPLVKSGAGTCAAQVNALASATMGGVVSFNTAAHWALTKPDQRPVSVFIGQKFANPAVPYGATGVFATPNGQSGCDGLSVQVVPSAMSCSKLRETLSAHGKQIGDLAGIPLMEDAGGQTMLVPTAADACVMVGVRSAYAK